MGRQKDTDILGRLERRMSGGKPAEAPAAPAAQPERTKKPSSRDGMKFVGFYASEDQTERLRVLAFEQRQEKQILMREALELLFKKYSQ